MNEGVSANAASPPTFILMRRNRSTAARPSRDARPNPAALAALEPLVRCSLFDLQLGGGAGLAVIVRPGAGGLLEMLPR